MKLIINKRSRYYEHADKQLQNFHLADSVLSSVRGDAPQKIALALAKFVIIAPHTKCLSHRKHVSTLPKFQIAPTADGAGVGLTVSMWLS